MAAQMAGVAPASSAVSAHAEHVAHGAGADPAAVQDGLAQQAHGTAPDETAAQAPHAPAHAGHAATPPSPIGSASACHGESAAHAPPPTACGAASGDHAAHGACADCEICHTVVMAPAAPAPGAVSHGGSLRVPAAVRFASALPAQATKPPIS